MYAVEQAPARVRAKLVGFSGKVYSETELPAIIPANRAARFTVIEFPLADLEDVFFLDLELLDVVQTRARNRYVFTRTANLAPLLAVPQTTLAVHSAETGDKLAVTVTNNGDVSALFVWLEDGRPLGSPGYAYILDNHFCLFPGEEMRTLVWWDGVEQSERRLTVRGWNTP